MQLEPDLDLNKLLNELFCTQNGAITKEILCFDQARV
jgi:hypothetical protein